MGTFYNAKCQECGYEFQAVYGRGAYSGKENEVMKAFENGTRTDELA